MSKRSWYTWAFTGMFGLSVAGGAVVARGQTPGNLAPAAGPATRVIPNSSTDVKQLLKAYGITPLPAVKPATDANTVASPTVIVPLPKPVPAASPSAEQPNQTVDSAGASVATDLANDAARYQISRLPKVEEPAGPRPVGTAIIIPVTPEAEPSGSNIIRTGRFEPSDAPAAKEQPTGAAAKDASSLGWYELGISSRRSDRGAEPAPRSVAPSRQAKPDEDVEPNRGARRDEAKSVLQPSTARRYEERRYEEEEVASRPEPRQQRPEPPEEARRGDASPRSARLDEDYKDSRTDAASRYEQDRLRPAPLRQRYAPASYAAEQPREQTREPGELRDAPRSRSVRPDDVAEAITSRREMLMVDEDRFTAASRQADAAWQTAPHASLARYRVEEQAAAAVQPGPQGIIYPPGGPNLMYGSGPCNACGPLCDPCACSCGWLWVFGAEATMLWADRDGLDAAVELVTPADRIFAEAEDNLGVGPRLWFGARSCKWEVLGRFWVLGDVFDDHDPLRLGTNDRTGVFQGSDLEAFTADAEIVRHFCCGPCWDIYCGLGFRYASLEQVARVSGTINDTQAVAGFGYADAIAYNQIDGPGITAVFGGSRLLHCYCHSSLNAFWNVRASMIWGDVDTTAQTTVLAADTLGGAAAGRVDAAYANTEGDMTIGELQAGLRWCHPLRCMPAVASVHVAFETQWWDADGGIAFAEGAAIANQIGAAAQASAGPNSEVLLVGFTTGCGLTW